MAPHSSTFAWKIPWMEEPGGLQFMGSLESDTTERLHFHFSLSCTGDGNGNPLQCSCLENPRDGEPGELPSMGSHRVGHDWSDLAAAAAERINTATSQSQIITLANNILHSPHPLKNLYQQSRNLKEGIELNMSDIAFILLIFLISRFICGTFILNSCKPMLLL